MIRMILFFLVILALIVACSESPASAPFDLYLTEAAGELEAIDVCLSSTNINRSALEYAQKYGLFEKYGLDVNLIDITGGSNSATALMAGDADICQIAGPAVVNADLAGGNLVIIGGILNRALYSLMVRPEIKTAADLVGQNVGVSDPGTGSDAILRYALESLGLVPDEDVIILSIGGNSERLAALDSGTIAGTVILQPQSGRAKEMGFSALLSPEDIDLPHQHTAIVVSQSFLDERRETAVSFIKAISEATSMMKNDREGTVNMIADVFLLDIEEDSALIDEAYNEVILKHLDKHLTPNRAGVQRLIDVGRAENPTAVDLTVDDIVDESIIQELEETGFFAKLD